MSKKKYKNCCTGVADQYLTLVTIYAAIINQQFDNADELEVFADFLIALGEELSLAASVRGMCEEGVGEDFEVDVDESTIISLVDGFQRAYKNNHKRKDKY